jgi:serine phosphatase RsbU (regulator of sigma subunit)
VEHKEGRELPLLTSVGPVRDDAGEVIGGIEVFRDETEAIQQKELARSVQRQMLTAPEEADPKVSFEVEYTPRDLIGGDFYHLRRVSDDRFSVLVGDAAGHGISAALYCSIIYCAINESADQLHDPAALLAAVNRRACDRARGLGFFTAVSATVDTAGGRITYSSAGHPAPILQRAEGLDVLRSSGLPIGVSADAEYENTTVGAAPGDRFLAFTDGVTEIPVGEGKRLGTEGLLELLTELPAEEGEHRLGHLYAAILGRCAEVQPPDDITLVSCILR